MHDCDAGWDWGCDDGLLLDGGGSVDGKGASLGDLGSCGWPNGGGDGSGYGSGFGWPGGWGNGDPLALNIQAQRGGAYGRGIAIGDGTVAGFGVDPEACDSGGGGR